MTAWHADRAPGLSPVRVLGVLVVAGVAVQAQTPRQTDCPPTIRYLHHDATGNLWAVTDQTGTVTWRAEVWPFGEGVPTSAEAALRFVDEPRVSDIGLSDGLYHLGRRTYDPLSGRFLSTDPLPLSDVRRDEPQRFNRFSYGLNNPTRYVDRTGASPEEKRPTTPNTEKKADLCKNCETKKVPIIIFNENGEIPPLKLLDPDAARKAILKKQDKGEAPLPDAARKAVEKLRRQRLLEELGGDPLRQQVLDRASRVVREKETRTPPGAKVLPPPPPLSLCDCKLQPPVLTEEAR
jgi:RHS repeat-associated protein